MTTDNNTSETTPAEVKVVTVRERLRKPEMEELNDFRVVLYIIWQTLGFKKPTRVQLEIADFLQNGDSSLPLSAKDYQIIMAFRGVGKTWVTAAFVCWCLLMDPTLRILVVSKSGDKAKEILAFSRRLIREIPIFQHLDPSNTDLDTTEAFNVVGCGADVQPSFKSLGIKGQLPGNRADILIPDDVETIDNSLTQTQRADLDKRVAEFVNIRKPGGLINMLGTPQSQDSMYERQSVESGGVYNIRIWPARYPTPKMRANPRYFNRVAPRIRDDWDTNKVGKITDPERWTEEILLNNEIANGSAGWALQFMLDASLADAEKYKLKLRDLMILDWDGTKVPVDVVHGTSKEINDLENPGFPGDKFYAPIYTSEYFDELTKVHMAIDPSGNGADQTAYAVGGVLNGKAFLLEWSGTRAEFTKRFELLASVAKRWGVHKVLVEKNHGGGLFTSNVKGALEKAGVGCEVEEFNSVGNKEARIINTLEPITAGHKLVVRKAIVQQDMEGTDEEKQDEWASQRRGLYQFTRITPEKRSLKFDDKVDVLAMLVNSLQDELGMEIDGSEEEHKQRVRQQLLNEFLANMKQSSTESGGGLFDLLAMGNGQDEYVEF